MSSWNELEITYTRNIQTGKNMRLWLNGNEIKWLTGLDVSITPDDLTKATLSFLVSDIEVNEVTECLE